MSRSSCRGLWGAASIAFTLVLCALTLTLMVAVTALAAQAAPLETDPLRLSPEARAWLNELGPLLGRPESRMRVLLEALVDPEPWTGLAPLVEISGLTRTAAGAFAAGEADCVSLAHLLVALGREAGVRAHFVAYRGSETARHQAGLRVEVWHLAAGVETRRGLTAFDFGGVSRPGSEQAERVTDARAASIYLSNRGAERLLAGDPMGALPWLRRAVTADAEHLAAWVNLSVALRRAGQADAARRAADRALALENQ